MVDEGYPQARLAKCDNCEGVLPVMTTDDGIGKINGECNCGAQELRLLELSDVDDPEETTTS